MSALVEVHDLAKTFDVSAPWLNRVVERKPRQFVHAVDGVSFSIERGKTLALVGESGCGKSTVARLLVGLYPPSQGRVSFDGADTATAFRSPQARAMRKRMQMIFQDPYASLNPRWKVADIVGEPLKEHGLIGHVAHDGQVVRDEEVGQAALALQVLHDVEHLRLHAHVERRRGLVANQELGLRGQRARDRNALALAARELVRELVDIARSQAHRRQQLGHAGTLLAIVGDDAVLANRFGHDVEHLPARIQACVRILEDHLHAPAQGA